ncbi:hypothetical protein D3C74_446480 [compost metagenome]
MTVCYQLTRSSAGVSKPKAVNEVVKAALKQEHEVLTGNTLHFLSFREQCAELLLAQTVHVAQFLFFLQLHTVVAHFSALVSSVLTWRERTFQFFACSAQGNAEATA